MKITRRRPIQEARVVKVDEGALDADTYELWILKPEFVGHITRRGAKTVVIDGGKTFFNIPSAASELLERRNNFDLAQDILSLGRPQPKESDIFAISGMDLVVKNKWVAFCELRQLDPRAMDQIQKTHALTRAEITQLGIEP